MIDDHSPQNPQMNIYYHVTPIDNWKRIITDGIEPSECSECQTGLGVHLCSHIDQAKEWVSIFREERDLYYAEFALIEVQISEHVEIVQDQMAGSGYYPTGHVVCTETPIPPDQLHLIEWRRT